PLPHTPICGAGTSRKKTKAAPNRPVGHREIIGHPEPSLSASPPYRVSFWEPYFRFPALGPISMLHGDENLRIEGNYAGPVGNFDMSGTATNPRGAGQPRSKRVSPDDEAALSVGRLVLLSSALVDLISSAI